MLSGETAYGKYPVESIEMMSKIALQVESSKPPIKETPKLIVNNEISAFLAISAIKASVELNTKAIIADTKRGRTVRALAAYRGNNIIYSQCYDKNVMRELALSYGVYTSFSKMDYSADHFLCEALESLLSKTPLDINDRIVIIAGNFGPSKGPSFIEISKVKDIQKMCKLIHKK